MKKQVFPPGWDEARVRKVIAHYENQTEDEEVAEDEAARKACTMMAVPHDLVPAVCALLDRAAKRGKQNGKPVKRGISKASPSS